MFLSHNTRTQLPYSRATSCTNPPPPPDPSSRAAHRLQLRLYPSRLVFAHTCMWIQGVLRDHLPSRNTVAAHTSATDERVCVQSLANSGCSQSILYPSDRWKLPHALDLYFPEVQGSVPAVFLDGFPDVSSLPSVLPQHPEVTDTVLGFPPSWVQGYFIPSSLTHLEFILHIVIITLSNQITNFTYYKPSWTLLI